MNDRANETTSGGVKKGETDKDLELENAFRQAFAAKPENSDLAGRAPVTRQDLQALNRILANQPQNAKGPRLAFELGRFVCVLPIDARITVGREGAALDLAIPSPSLSRQHFEINHDEKTGGAVLRDLRSRNQTKVNGRPILKPHILIPGDRIRAGGITFYFIDDDDDGGETPPARM